MRNVVYIDSKNTEHLKFINYLRKNLNSRGITIAEAGPEDIPTHLRGIILKFPFTIFYGGDGWVKHICGGCADFNVWLKRYDRAQKVEERQKNQ